VKLRDKRATYAPFVYPQAYEYFMRQNQAFWLHTEVSMSSDIADWNQNLNEAQKMILGNTLKGFVQPEVVVGNYWRKVAGWFPHPEIGMMAAAFAGMEAIHTAGYAYLNQSMGLEDYEAFLQEPAAKAKIDRLVGVKGRDLKSIARSLAVFSAFTEGVNLFSSFAILMNFSRFNLMKGLGQIVSFSVRDESLHSEGGCWLFRQLVSEYSDEIWTDDLKKDIYDAARATVELEDQFIDWVFSKGQMEGLTSHDLKSYIRHRANTKLLDLGLKTNWKKVDKEAVSRITEWFDLMVAGVHHTDFFSTRVTDYGKATINFDDAF
jgi:ribonucleoside-diphosphate reductase beta chain